MTEQEHRFEILLGVVNSDDDDLTYGVACMCGWTSKRYESRQDAVDDGDDHVIAMTR